MSLLELKNIGKIYASGGTVAVGVRGVSLSFDRGELVAVTGESGSGKTTFLNVISGMDGYEEGEMYVEGEPTSHFLQPEWEEYRKKYISFIFQDYNIIESFTVLQNVELALMHLKSAAERRKKALELLERVGLTDFADHKGSRLSGGQKQRTVIARALAKDSPVILADEPTGNLDAKTSAEIIDLLKEVSADKLLIIVTHDFAEVEKCATRHVRFFDGSVESDKVISEKAAVDTPIENPEKITRKGILSNGLTLGWSIFRSRPLLSFFLCLLLLFGALAIFSLTISSGSAMRLFERNYMFSHINGRVIVARRDGAAVTDAEARQVAGKYGAGTYRLIDGLLDERISLSTDLTYYNGLTVRVAGQDGKDLGASAPEKATDVFLFLPVWYEGEEAETVYYGNAGFRVTGTEYFRNTNEDGVIYVTESGYRLLTALSFFESSSFTAKISGDNSSVEIRVSDRLGRRQFSTLKEDSGTTLAEISCIVRIKGKVSASLEAGDFDYKQINADRRALIDDYGNIGDTNYVFVSPEDYTELFEKAVLSENGWGQFSLFFESDRDGRKAAKAITGEEYIAVSSDAEIKMGFVDALGAVIVGGISAVMWIVGVIFIAFFINLCTSRTISAFSVEMAIMRSMGIPVSVIKAGMYFRMLISALPAVILTTVAGIVIFSVPALSAMFTYMSPWMYALIYVGIFVIVLRVTRKQVKKLFGSSVREAIRGGRS